MKNFYLQSPLLDNIGTLAFSGDMFRSTEFSEEKKTIR